MDHHHHEPTDADLVEVRRQAERLLGLLTRIAEADRVDLPALTGEYGRGVADAQLRLGWPPMAAAAYGRAAAHDMLHAPAVQVTACTHLECKGCPPATPWPCPQMQVPMLVDDTLTARVRDTLRQQAARWS